MDPIKEAFAKVKIEIQEIKEQINEIKRTLNSIQQTDKPTDNQQINKSLPQNTTILSNPTNKSHLYSPITNYNEVSTGNNGVPTDRQTNRQTIQHIDKISKIEHLSQILNSLDSIKKDIRSTFKHLTNQEMLVFSTIYQLEEEGFIVDYSLISKKLSLTESSIRDYVLKLIKKGIPVIKTKHNNKKIVLSISPELKKIASLQTILSLREL
ncbi:MAG: hypothetical protein N3D20_00410 [Candidatus Pacearchaeota archaeon]|nr:hypothetical protein [Candidatus Pacearchaeota archaeon]